MSNRMDSRCESSQVRVLQQRLGSPYKVKYLLYEREAFNKPLLLFVTPLYSPKGSTYLIHQQKTKYISRWVKRKSIDFSRKFLGKIIFVYRINSLRRVLANTWMDLVYTASFC